MSNEKLTLTDGTLEILNLSIRDDSIVNYFRGVPEEELEHTFLKTLRVGVVCLERASNVQDLDYVRHEIEGFLHSVEKASADIPGSIQRKLAGKIGTGDGQLFSSIPGIIGGLQTVVDSKCNQIRTILERDIDPSRPTSALGSALTRIQQLLNPKDSDSIQARLQSAVDGVTAKDGQIAKSVKDAAEELIRPLREKLDELSTHMIGKKAAADVVAQTTLKGPAFEEEVLSVTKRRADVAGCLVEHVGGDNSPGDILIESQNNGLMEEVTRIVIEAKDTQVPDGRKVVSDRLLKSMETRQAHYGIYVKREADQFGTELGDWGEGVCQRGQWISCSLDNLRTALRFAFVQRRLSAIRSATPEVDAVAIEGQIGRIRTALRKITNIATESGKIEQAVRNIKREADELRTDVQSALSDVETALRVPTQTPVPPPSEAEDLPF